MTQTLLRAGGLAAVYLLVITSLAPGDLLAAGVLGLAASLALRPRDEARGGAQPHPARRLAAAAGVALHTAAEMARGSWRVARFCLDRRGEELGFVELPRAGRSRHNVALWGVLTGEAPDEYPVDVDEERDVLIVHVVDASDPDAVRARHADQMGSQRRVVP